MYLFDEIQLKLGEVKSIPRHQANGWDLFFLLKGEALMELDGNTYTMRSEDIVLCNSGQSYAFSSENANILLHLHISRDLLTKEFTVYDHIFCNTLLDTDRHEAKYFELKRLATRLMLSYYQQDEGYWLKLHTALFQLLNYIFSNFRATGGSEDPPSINHLEDEHIWETVQYINSHFRSNITLQMLAKQEHLSVHYLSRIFKRKMGQGFLDYLTSLRLKSAVQDLMHSDDTIIAVALNNGFPSGGAFSKAFHRQYGESPSSFRQKNAVHDSSDRPEFLLADLQSGQELIAYLNRFDIKFPDAREKSASYHIDTQAKPLSCIPLWRRLIRVGRACEVLKHEVLLQLDYLQKHLHIDYVHFKAFFTDGMCRYPENGAYTFYEYDRVFDYLNDLQVCPFIQIDINDALNWLPPGASFAAAVERLQMFLRHYAQHYRKAMGEWLFEITYSPGGDREMQYRYYCQLYEGIKSFLPGCGVGLAALDVRGRPLDQNLSDWLEMAGNQGCYPDFITVYSAFEHIPDITGDVDYRQFQGYYAALFKQVEEAAGALRKVPPLYLADWNTLRGTSAMKLDPFFRSALIIDALMEIGDHVSGAAFWANSYVCEALNGQTSSNILAMFIQRVVKRPVFFVMSLLEILQGQLVYCGEFVRLARTDGGAYVLLVYNPCYFNPLYATDDSFLETQKRRITLVLENLRGRFVFERFILDNERGAMYNRWAAMGFPSLLDRNIVEYLEANVNMDYSMFEENISGPFNLDLELKFNAAVLFRITEPR